MKLKQWVDEQGEKTEKVIQGHNSKVVQCNQRQKVRPIRKRMPYKRNSKPTDVCLSMRQFFPNLFQRNISSLIYINFSIKVGIRKNKRKENQFSRFPDECADSSEKMPTLSMSRVRSFPSDMQTWENHPDISDILRRKWPSVSGMSKTG